MSPFEFISHEKYPEDEYTLESVTLCFEGKYRVIYIRKKMKNGGVFWDVISASVTKHGDKKYLRSFSQDSIFLAIDIKNYLEGRKWEIGKSASFSKNDEQLPF